MTPRASPAPDFARARRLLAELREPPVEPICYEDMDRLLLACGFVKYVDTPSRRVTYAHPERAQPWFQNPRYDTLPLSLTRELLDDIESLLERKA